MRTTEPCVRIRLLGTGTPTPSLRRMCSGYVVEIGSDVIVLDHGFGAHHRLLELGIPRHTGLAPVLHAPALRPLRRLRAPRADALGPGRGPRSRAQGLWPTAARAHDRAAVRQGRRLRCRSRRAHEPWLQPVHLRSARRHSAATASRSARHRAEARRRGERRRMDARGRQRAPFPALSRHLRLPAAARRPHVRLLGRQRADLAEMEDVRARRRCAGAHVPSHLRHGAQRRISPTPAWATWSSRTWRRGRA